MTLDLTCQACDTSFELDLAELIDEPRVQCPSCDARVPTAVAEGLSSALDELLGHLGRLRQRFQLVLQVDSEDLPPPYDRERRATSHEDEDEDEEPEEDLGPDEDEALGRDAED